MSFPTKNLGELCEFQGGSQPAKSNFVYEPTDGYVRFLQIRDFGSEKNHTYIPVNKKNKNCDSDDIMIGRYGASVGKILRGRSGAYNVALMKASPVTRLINKEFFWFYLNSYFFQNDLRKVASRSAQDGFSKDDIFNFQVPLPSIPTQQKIVAKLDAIFAEIDIATAAAEANAKNAEALFQSYLDKLFEHDAVLYNKINIKDVCKIGDGNHSSKYPKKHEMVESGVAFIRSTNIVNGTISDKELVYLTEAKHKELKKGHLKTGDVLITNRGEIGKVAIVDKRFNNSNLNSQIAWLRCNPTLNNQYLLYFLMSAKMKNFYSDTKTGAALQQLPIGKIEKIKIPLPNLEVQNSRCFEFMSVQQKCLVSISSYKTKLVQLFELKQSILQRAFSGELVKD